MLKYPPFQKTKKPTRLREWKGLVRSEAQKFWPAGQPAYSGPLRIVVVHYHERPSVLMDHDNLIKPIQDALAGLVYRNDRQITDAMTRKTSINGRFRVRYLSKLYAEAFQRGREFIYIE